MYGHPSRAPATQPRRALRVYGRRDEVDDLVFAISSASGSAGVGRASASGGWGLRSWTPVGFCWGSDTMRLTLDKIGNL